MTRTSFFALLCGLLLAGTQAFSAPVAVYQAFNQSFDEIRSQASRLAGLGFTHVQVSPPQKSLDRTEWWARYQPVDYGTIDGPLGNESQFREMNKALEQHGLKTLVDTVFNHMANTGVYRSLEFPQFGPADFHFPETRPCILDWGNRYETTQYWLCFPEGKLPDLDTSRPHVIQVHREYLEKLARLGVDGLRLDAAKHIETPYFEELLNAVPSDWLVYGEIVGTSLAESMEYAPYMKVSDFHFLGEMLGVFRTGGDLGQLRQVASRGLPSPIAVTFARNHDTAMSPTFFNFATYADALMATAFVLARAEGTPVVYRDDAEQPVVRAALRFRRVSGDAPTRFPTGLCFDCDRRELLFLARGDSWAVFNNGEQWYENSEVKSPGVSDGVYRELQYGFSVRIQKGRIVHWSNPGRSGIQIGPKTALFFISAESERRSTWPAR